jgi:glycosyltransferase involved in cell wall biosynthesis
MLLYGLVKSEDHVCCRYRLSAFRDYLTPAGHELEIRAWPASWLERLLIQKSLYRADVVLIQRRLLSRWELLLVRRSARRLVFDFDDAVFLRDSYATAGLGSATRQKAFARMVRAADLVVAGNSFLADTARKLAPAARVEVEPTRVDPSKYPPAKHVRSGAGVCMVWIGSSSTLQGLVRSAALWEEIGNRCPGVSLKLVCDKPLSFKNLDVEFKDWSEAREVIHLADADIGVSWVPDDDWSRGKCGLKVLQYMAAGLPVVANPVGVQAHMVRDGKTGYLANTPSEWSAAIARLAADAGLRRRLGQAGRAVVEAEYSVQAGADLWVRRLEQLVKLRHPVEAAA